MNTHLGTDRRDTQTHKQSNIHVLHMQKCKRRIVTLSLSLSLSLSLIAHEHEIDFIYQCIKKHPRTCRPNRKNTKPRPPPQKKRIKQQQQQRQQQKYKNRKLTP